MQQIFVITKGETLWFSGRKWSDERPDAMEFATLDEAEAAIDGIAGVELSQDEIGQWKQTDEGPVWQRITVEAEDKPDAETIAQLKARGFRWSPTEGAWQRMLNNAGIWAAKTVVDWLTARAA